MLATILNAIVSNYLIMYVLGYMIGVAISFLLGFMHAAFSKEKFVPLLNAYGVVVGYRVAKIPPNTFIQYAAAYTNYKPVFDVEGNVAGFSFQRAQDARSETHDTTSETDDPTPAA